MDITFFNEHNICVIPVHPKSKRPKPCEWQRRQVDHNNEPEFSPDDNIGVVLGKASGGLVDIDLDSDVARELAPHFLPPTGCVFGRRSAPRSHFLFRVSGDPGGGRKFGGKFAEYRANGQMTVVPPSVHVTGESIEWASCENIGETTRSELLDALASMAICATVVPQYDHGKRHDIILALAGTLLKNGKSEDEVLRLVEVLCQVTGDMERTTRLNDVRSTAIRMDRGEPITQLRHLRELIGESAIGYLREYLGAAQPKRARDEPRFIGILDPDDQNDSGVAEAFSRRVRDRVCFAKDAGNFYVFEDGLWAVDEHELEVWKELNTFVKDRVDELRMNFSGVVSQKELEHQCELFCRYRDHPKGRNAIKQLRGLVPIKMSDFDRDDDVVAVQNGLLNLRNGSVTPCRAEHYITKRLEVAHDPSADCPIFRRVLSDAFKGDEALVEYFTGVMGYWLTGQNNRQEFYILHGDGANGKSTIIEAITNVLGLYAGTLMSESIFETPTWHHSSDLASMVGCRLGVVHEAESKFRLNSARLKQITGGDWIKARALYKNPFSYRPQFKIVIICNRRPDFDAYDEAFKRRVKLIPFENVIPRECRDPQLGEKLKAEAPGILNLMIEGAQRYFRNEIREPNAVRNATRIYFGDQDSISSFIKDATIKEPGRRIGKGELYQAYQSYCEDEAMLFVSKGEFGRILKRMGFTDTRTGMERQWKGLTLRASHSETDETDINLDNIFEFAV